LVYFPLCLSWLSSLSFLDLWTYNFQQVWKVLGCYFLRCFLTSAFLWDCYVRSCDIVPQVASVLLLCLHVHSLFLQYLIHCSRNFHLILFNFLCCSNVLLLGLELIYNTCFKLVPLSQSLLIIVVFCDAEV
jgi:hypothetical protein